MSDHVVFLTALVVGFVSWLCGWYTRDAKKCYCRSCKHYAASNNPDARRCTTGVHEAVMGTDRNALRPVFIPDPTYGCVFWERKAK